MSVQLSTPPLSKDKSSEKSTTPKSSKKKFFSNLLHRKNKNETSPNLGLNNGLKSRSSSASTKVSSSPSLTNKLKRQPWVSNNSKRTSRSQVRGRSKGPDVSGNCIDDDDDSVFNYAEEDEIEDSRNVFDMTSSLSSLSHAMSSHSLNELGVRHNNSSNTNIGDMINLTMQSTDAQPQPWDGLTPESLVVPQYVKTHRRNKHSPRALNNLFLAQELNVESCASKNHNDNDSISSESLKQGTSSDDDHDEILYEHETQATSEFFSDSQGYSKRPAHKRKNKNDFNEVYVMEFSRDGKYLAVAGRNSIIKIWKVISSPLSRLEQKNAESLNENSKSKKTNKNLYKGAPVFHQAPVRVFKGHTHSVLSLDWSKNNFLISGSMDRLVKLWHVDRLDCLETFQNDDFVTTVKFHPMDDRFFLSGSLDNQVRLWSILEKNIAYNKDLGDDILITAASFTPDGQHCIVGGFNGSIFALEINGLHVINRFEVKEKSFVHSFHNKNGNKITGIKIFESREYSRLKIIDDDPLAKWNFLITTNDSKIRLVNSDLKKLVTRFKGLTNTSSSIVADMTDDFHYIVSGSEDHWCYVWENNNSIINNKLKLALKDLVLEGKNHINDLQSKHKSYAKLIHKNPLMKKLNVQKFLDDENAIEYVANENNSYVAFHPHHSKVNVAVFAPENTKKLLELSDDLIFELIKRGKKYNLGGVEDDKSLENDNPDDFSSEIGVNGGHIIITTDQYGLIRVFRQDSAYEVRKKLRDILKLKKENCSKLKSDSKVNSCNQLCDSKTNKNNLRLDLPRSRSTRLANNRSLSPSNDGYFALKNKLHSRIKGNSNGISNTSSSLSTMDGKSSNPGTPSSMYQISDHRSSSQSNLPRFVSSSSLVNGATLHNTSSSGIMSQVDATVDIRNDDIDSISMSEKSYIPETGNTSLNAPESAYTLTLTPSNDNKSSRTLTATPPVSSTKTEVFPALDNQKKGIPLLINTGSTVDNKEDKSEIINFHTLANDSINMDRAFEGPNSNNSSFYNAENNTRGRM